MAEHIPAAKQRDFDGNISLQSINGTSIKPVVNIREITIITNGK